MATKAKPPAGSPSGEDTALAAEIVRLTNRTALLTLAAAFSIIASLIAVPRALLAGTTGVGRLAAALPVAAAVIAVMAVWRSRGRLRAARAQALAGPGRTERPPRAARIDSARSEARERESARP
jgi:hypothetical protein